MPLLPPYHLVFFLFTLLTPSLALFDLNSPKASWQYTSSSLADTTTPKCRSIYARPINCALPLLRLVGNQLPDYRPSQKDLDNICTIQCKNALESYVSQLGEACEYQGDLAKQAKGKNGNLPDEEEEGVNSPGNSGGSGDGGSDADEEDDGEEDKTDGHDGDTDGSAGPTKTPDEKPARRMVKRQDDGQDQNQDQTDSKRGNNNGTAPNGYGKGKNKNKGKGKKKKGPKTYRAVRVWTIGHMLEYGYAQACSRDLSNAYCLLSNSSSTSNPSSRPIPPSPLSNPNYNPPATCNSTCSVSFYKNARKFGPAAKRTFRGPDLVMRDPQQLSKWDDGIEVARKCKGGNNSGGKGGESDIKTGGKGRAGLGEDGDGNGGGSASGSTGTATGTATVTSSVGATTSTGSAAASATAAVATGAASRGRAPMWFGLIGVAAVMLFR